MNEEEAWYIVKQSSGACEILSASQMETDQPSEPLPDSAKQWGPFASRTEAIARRVGLIRAGKCQPV